MGNELVEIVSNNYKDLVFFFKENKKNIKNINCGNHTFIIISIDSPEIEELPGGLCFFVKSNNIKMMIYRILFKIFKKQIDNTYYIECIDNIVFEVTLNS